MGDVIQFPQPEAGEGGWLACPHCADQDGFWYPLCRATPQGMELRSIVCSACGTEVPLDVGYLQDYIPHPDTPPDPDADPQ